MQDSATQNLKNYRSPALVKYGELADLTAGGSPMMREFIMTMMGTVPGTPNPDQFGSRRP